MQNCTLSSLCMELPSMHKPARDNTPSVSWVSVHALFWIKWSCFLVCFLDFCFCFFVFFNNAYYYDLHGMHNIKPYSNILLKQLFYSFLFHRFINYFSVFVSNLVMLSLKIKTKKSQNLCFWTLILDALSLF